MYTVSTSAKLALPVICKGMIDREIPLRDIFYTCTHSDGSDVSSDLVCQRFTVPMRLAIDSAYHKILCCRRIHCPQQAVSAWWGNNLYEMICATSVCAVFALLVRALLKNNADKRVIQVRGTNNKWQIEYDAYTNLLAIWIAKYEVSDHKCDPYNRKVYEHTDWVCETKWAIRSDVQSMDDMLKDGGDESFTAYYNAMERVMLQVCGDGTLYYRIRGTLKKHVLVPLVMPRTPSFDAHHSLTSVNFMLLLTPFVEPLVRLVLTWVRVYGSDSSRGKTMLSLLQDPTICKRIASVISNVLLFNFGPEETRGVTNKNLTYFSVSLSETMHGLKFI
jgi:hypothetical protein